VLLELAIERLSVALSALSIFPKTIPDKGGNMKTRSFLWPALVLCLLTLMLNGSASARGVSSQDPNKPKIPEAEAKAVGAVEAAPDIDAKIAAAGEFVKTYPKSTARQQVAEYIADQILAVKDAAQKLTLAEKFPTVFTDKAEADWIKPALVDAYIQLSRFDEAFAEGAAYLAKKTDDISLLINLTITGVEQAKKQNPKYVNASRQYGIRAIELFETNKKPADMDAAVWEKQKLLLPQVYQELAIISLMEQKPAEARAKLEKAMSLNPADPSNYALLADVANDDYQQSAQAYKSMPEGKAKDEMLQKATAQMDKVIDLYAHAAALSEGNPLYKQFYDQVLQYLTPYYKYRHSNSTAGLQQLIDQYKAPAKPQ
jgi:hypothetical protein